MFKYLFNEGPAYLPRGFEMLASIPGKKNMRSFNSLKVVRDEYKLGTTDILTKIIYILYFLNIFLLFNYFFS